LKGGGCDYLDPPNAVTSPHSDPPCLANQLWTYLSLVGFTS